MGVVYFVHRFVVAILKDSHLALVVVEIAEAMFVSVFLCMAARKSVGQIFGDGIEMLFLQSTVAAGTMTAAASRVIFVVCTFQWAVVLAVGILGTITFHVLCACLAEPPAVLTLRDWTAFLVDVHQRSFRVVAGADAMAPDACLAGVFLAINDNHIGGCGGRRAGGPGNA